MHAVVVVVVVFNKMAALHKQTVVDVAVGIIVYLLPEFLRCRFRSQPISGNNIL